MRRDEERVQAKPLALQLALSGMEKRLSLVYYVNRLERRGHCGRYHGGSQRACKSIFFVPFTHVYIYRKREWLGWSYWCRRARRQEMRGRRWSLGDAADRNSDSARVRIPRSCFYRLMLSTSANDQAKSLWRWPWNCWDSTLIYFKPLLCKKVFIDGLSHAHFK